jgi:hypothetical protein
MPRVYRSMKREGDHPKLGASSTTLGVRNGVDITPDASGNVAPRTGGISVRPDLGAIPLRFLPKRLHDSGRAPGAFGSNSLNVWRVGEGTFAAGEVAKDLGLRVDPDDAHHGFLEPADEMSFGHYSSAVEETRSSWTLDER